MTQAWQAQLKLILSQGEPIAPRGRKTLELPQATVSFDMRHPVVTVSARKLHVPFLGGEAYWILSGDDTVAGIERYNRHIANFSDDGQTFFGAYGPKIVAQLPYVVEKLREDPMSRQAGLTLWRESPPKTKDVPCTIAMFFNIRQGRLNAHIFMRSSDAWLGLPYDAFNFTMVACEVLWRLNQDRLLDLTPGTQHLTAASSHLYREHWADALTSSSESVPGSRELPPVYSRGAGPLLTFLDDLRRSKKGDAVRWFA